MATTLNDVERVDLEIHQNADLVFQVEWWADDEETDPIPLTGAVGAVRGDTSADDPVLLNLATYTTIDDNVAKVRVPYNITAGLAPMSRGAWDYTIIAATGEHKKVCRGNARVHRAVGR